MDNSLMEVVEQLSEFRQAKGKRHELGRVVMSVVLGLLCSQNSLRQIATWGRHLAAETAIGLAIGPSK